MRFENVSMSWIDWLIVIIPVAFVYYMGIRSRRYVRSVADFLSAGRVCGRYVINVGDIANALSIIGIVTMLEQNYSSGFALTFWSYMLIPVGVFLGLTGFCTYRFRETKAMSLGQFLEMRYSRKFRIFAATLRTLSEVITNSIMPAIAARFFIFFLDWPRYINICGIQVSTFMLIMFVCLFIAISIICFGGTLSLIITDSLQGMIIYPLMAIFVIFVLVNFSWSEEIVPVMADRAPGESFLDPFDISKLRTFNMFSLLILPLFSSVMHRASWIGAGYSTAAKTPHESKMGGLLGSWRNALNVMMYVLFAAMLITLLNHKNFAEDALVTRQNLARQINEEPMLGLSDDMKARLDAVIAAQQPQIRNTGDPRSYEQKDPDTGEVRIITVSGQSIKSNLDTDFLAPIHQELLKGETGREYASDSEREAEANDTFKQYRTYFRQLSFAIAMREMLPVGMMGLFFLMLVMAMISTDDTRIYSASLTFTQDVIVPLCKKPLTMAQHVMALRITSIAVGVIFFFASIYMAQMSYVALFSTIICALWMGGCGPVMVFGLYSRIGTTAAAWTSLLTGMFLSLVAIVLDRNWADHIYPYLEAKGWVEPIGKVLETLSAPLPYITWEMDPIDCPVNSYEFYFFTMLITLALYLIVSYATCKEPFNLDRMLHRGIYNLDGENKDTEKLTFKNAFRKIIGITPEYTKGDKAIAWGFFIYSFVYQFLLVFLVVLIWNSISRWPIEWWSHYFFIVQLIVPGILAVITTFWFGYGGIRDLIQLFRDLETRKINHLDNGTVDGHVSLADKAEFEAMENDKEQESAKDPEEK
ncbi:MAG: sodium:panthothenate symporter [Lentisphaerae bacterium]|nr:sodium:panthothenate symporter [Lentisphaerota bacterium]